MKRKRKRQCISWQKKYPGQKININKKAFSGKRKRECVVTVVPAEDWLVCGQSHRDTRLTAVLMWVGNVRSSWQHYV
jgi:hypothetical protein